MKKENILKNLNYYIKRKIIENSIKVQVMSDRGLAPYTHIDEAKNYLKQISRILIHTMNCIFQRN